ncbi:MAG TPA: DUF2442 domain-containing protein [Anaerolineae bacterium]|nr:DUF2442 domain-containing protein [Anaerolineae bacterium]HMR64396.1 DUF2442 domain-containing protein [Anaerolineae bacterium]
MFLHLTEVNYLEDYKLRLKFNNGIIKDVDLRDELYGKVFEPLKEIELFKQVAVNRDTNTIEWPNGADFAPEFLYEVGQDIEQSVTLVNVASA